MTSAFCNHQGPFFLWNWLTHWLRYWVVSQTETRYRTRCDNHEYNTNRNSWNQHSPIIKATDYGHPNSNYTFFHSFWVKIVVINFIIECIFLSLGCHWFVSGFHLHQMPTGVWLILSIEKFRNSSQDLGVYFERAEKFEFQKCNLN